jgi:hypothetical protein
VLGRSAAAVTEYHYDDDGRLTHTTTTWEPRWLEEDLAWARAYLALLNDRCPGGCGHYLSESAAMERGEPVHTFTVPTPTRCHACTARAKAQEKYSKMEVRHPDALLWGVLKT